MRDRLFVGSAVAAGLAFASMFAYIAGATFVLQGIYGLSPQQFSYVFGINSVGIVAMGQLGGRLARRLPTVTGARSRARAEPDRRDRPGGQHARRARAAVLLGSLFVMVSAVGLVFPTATALAMADYPDRAGAASSLLGLGQFSAGAIAAPLVGIAGQATAVPLGVVALTASSSAALVFLLVVVPVLRARAGRPVEAQDRQAPVREPD